MNTETALWRAALFLLLFGGLAWVARATRPGRGAPASPLGRLRAAFGRGPGRLQCSSSIRLTPLHSVHVVEIGARQFVLACHPGGTTVLAADADSGFEHQGQIHAKAYTAA